MLMVACVEAGDYLGRGAEYVSKLKDMVTRHLSQPFEFVCLTDNPPRHAAALARHSIDAIPRGIFRHWWAKLYLFETGRFPLGTRILYLDLDTVVVGSLDRLVLNKGILHLADWGWTKNDYGSGVMVWDVGEHDEIWSRATAATPQIFRGDQDWMTHLGGWDALPRGVCVSYRYVSKAAPPAGASVVCFHGVPKPHELTSGWVPGAWR